MLHRAAFFLAVLTGLSVSAQSINVRGTDALFPPVTDYTARDGGFGPAVATRNTGDELLGADRVAVFRPAAAKYGQSGVKHPIIVWGNGSTNTVDIWQGFLSRVATFGFVVVAPEQTQVMAAHMNAGIDYVLRLARDPAGGDYGRIDTTKIGATGYSLGGMGAITVGSNARIGATFILASSGNVRNLKAPWAIVGGDADAIFNWSSISTSVTGSPQPAFGAVLAGIDHNRVAGNAKAQEAYIGWMRWRFMGDQAGRALFMGSACKICTDAAFSDVVKSANFDLLDQVTPGPRGRSTLARGHVIEYKANSRSIVISFNDQVRPSEIEIFDLRGKIVDNIIPQNSAPVSWRPNSRGCYMVSLRIESERYAQKILAD